ncbi:MAG: alpha/beta fold hydrolase [Anaerolineaceae bacterium]|nr:alpha/beta fold hydrolase [Anaerolineaceae bacterium]
MAVIGSILAWLFAIIFGFFTLSMLLLKNWISAVLLFVVVLLCLPPVSQAVKNKFDFSIHPLLKIGLILGLLFLFSRTLISSNITSIYSTPAAQSRFIEIYDEKMEEWPVEYEDLFLDTSYGIVHVIASGSEENTAMLLLHASGVSSWSWKVNAEALSRNYRIYAIDLISDAGKSEFTSLDHIMKTGKDQADLYAEIMDQLQLEKAFVVGASEGGFIASHLAMHYPQKVEKLVLMAPMGYSGAAQAIIRITLTQLFPLEFIQKSTFRWAFSDSEILEEEFKEWFPLIMTEINSVKVAPLPLTPEERQQISVPVLFIFGEKDNLVGDPEKAQKLVEDMQNVQVEIIHAGHLMGGEMPDECNQIILKYFAE